MKVAIFIREIIDILLDYQSDIDRGKNPIVTSMKSFVEKEYACHIFRTLRNPSFIIEKRYGSSREILLGSYPILSFQAIINKKLSE